MQNNPLANPKPELSALEQRTLARQDTRERAIFIIARNAIPVVGVLFLGWSAVNLVLLYFFDTLGGMWAIFAALLAQYFGGWTTLPWGTRFTNLLGVLALSLFLIAFFAIPLGVPVLILTQMQSYDVRAALNDTGFIFGLVSIAVLALASMLRHIIRLQQTSADDKWIHGESSYHWSHGESGNQRIRHESGNHWIRHEFGLLFVRWTVMIFLIFTVGALFLEFAPVLLILAYAVVLVISELYPERFLAAFDKKAAAKTATTPEPPSAKQRARWERKRKRRKK